MFNYSNLISGVEGDIFCLCTFHCSSIIVFNYKTSRQWECVWRQQERHCDTNSCLILILSKTSLNQRIPGGVGMFSRAFSDAVAVNAWQLVESHRVVPIQPVVPVTARLCWLIHQANQNQKQRLICRRLCHNHFHLFMILCIMFCKVNYELWKEKLNIKWYYLHRIITINKEKQKTLKNVFETNRNIII